MTDVAGAIIVIGIAAWNVKTNKSVITPSAV
jgi:hypothetical protein